MTYEGANGLVGEKKEKTEWRLEKRLYDRGRYRVVIR